MLPILHSVLASLVAVSGIIINLVGDSGLKMLNVLVGKTICVSAQVTAELTLQCYVHRVREKWKCFFALQSTCNGCCSDAQHQNDICALKDIMQAG